MAIGLKSGTVTSNDDSTNMGRVEVQIAGGAKVWAKPCVPYAGKKRGFVMLPQPGDGVWLAFEDDDPQKPVWIGCFWVAAGDLEYGDKDGFPDRNVPVIRTADAEILLGGHTRIHSEHFSIACPGFITVQSMNDSIQLVAKTLAQLQSFDGEVKLTAANDDVSIEAAKGNLSMTATGIEMGGWPIKFKAGDPSAKKIKELEDRIAALEADAET